MKTNKAVSVQYRPLVIKALKELKKRIVENSIDKSKPFQIISIDSGALKATVNTKTMKLCTVQFFLNTLHTIHCG